MTVHILLENNDERHKQYVEITKHDALFTDAQEKFNVIELDNKTLKEKLNILASIDYASGDIICFAGLCIRQFTRSVSEIAKKSQLNYIPGLGIDHRAQTIWPGKISRRLPIDKNSYLAWPMLLVIGNQESAKLSFDVISNLLDNEELCWPNYVPDNTTLEQALSLLSMLENWNCPAWFKLVDLSVRDLEIAPVMYATHSWHDWISFYPANGNFKLENHTQLYPVWLAGSIKPLEYWKT